MILNLCFEIFNFLSKNFDLLLLFCEIFFLLIQSADTFFFDIFEIFFQKFDLLLERFLTPLIVFLHFFDLTGGFFFKYFCLAYLELDRIFKLFDIYVLLVKHLIALSLLLFRFLQLFLQIALFLLILFVFLLHNVKSVVQMLDLLFFLL